MPNSESGRTGVRNPPPEYGDWYARNMYMEGSRQYKYHVQKYGHPSKFGFKDIIPTWKAEKFDPAYLMSLYKKAGAKYFVSMGVHHDNFDLWNSKLNEWNSVKMGPKKDIVGLFRQAALKEGLRFGVSEHLAVSYHWFQTSHGADKEGEYKGVPVRWRRPEVRALAITKPTRRRKTRGTPPEFPRNGKSTTSCASRISSISISPTSCTRMARSSSGSGATR